METANKILDRALSEVFERLAYADYPKCETVYADNTNVHKLIGNIRRAFIEMEKELLEKMTPQSEVKDLA